MGGPSYSCRSLTSPSPCTQFRNAINWPRILAQPSHIAHAAVDRRSALECCIELAALRAQETTAQHPLLLDTFAPALAEQAEAGQVVEPAATNTDANLFDLVITQFIDTQLLQAVSLVNMDRNQEYNQVVIVGDGCCTRPYRLLWPEGTVIFLVAPGEVHERAEAILKQQGARVPRGSLLRRLSADVQGGSKSFLDGLRRAGYRGDRLSVWVIQGTHRLGLDLPAVNAILTDASNAAALDSIIIGEAPLMTKSEVDSLLASYGLLGAAMEDLEVESQHKERCGGMLERWRAQDVRRCLFMAQQKRLSIEEIDIYEAHVAAAEEVGEDFDGDFS